MKIIYMIRFNDGTVTYRDDLLLAEDEQDEIHSISEIECLVGLRVHRPRSK